MSKLIWASSCVRVLVLVPVLALVMLCVRACLLVRSPSRVVFFLTGRRLSGVPKYVHPGPGSKMALQVGLTYKP